MFSSIGLITFLTPYIGHHACDEIGKECVATGKSVREAVLERGLLTEAQLNDIFSVENLKKPRYPGKPR